MAMYNARKHAKDGSAAVEAALTPAIANDLRWIEQTIASNGGSELYIASSHLTIADIHLSWPVQILFRFKMGVADTSAYPHVERWLTQLSQRPAYIAACADGFHDGLAWPSFK